MKGSSDKTMKSMINGKWKMVDREWQVSSLTNRPSINLSSFILLLMLLSTTSYSQVINRAEYFFDSDPGVGNATSLSFTPGATINETYNLSTSSLSTGFHTFNARVRDNTGTWSLFTTRTFYLIPNPFSISPSVNITRAEYFYDIDPGIGNGINIPVTANPSLNITINAPTTPLTAGFHTVNVRVRDDQGRWSLFTTRSFYLMAASALPANLVKLEYYVDTDPGIGQATTVNVAAAPTVNQLFSLDLPVLTPGSYTLNVRAKDSNGFWSSRVSAPFSITACPTLTPPTVTGGSSCGPGAVTLNAAGATGSQVYRWYADATTTSILFTGSSFTTPSLTNSTTYFVSIFDSGICESTRTSVTATVNALPTAPTVVGASGCEPSSLTLTASGGTAGQYRWYTVATGGTAIGGQANATFTTPSLSATTTYFVSFNNGTCESTRTAVNANINSVPAAPTVMGASGCSPSTVTLSASGGTAGQYSWYTVATGGTPITGQVNSTFTTPSLSATTTYFVSINNVTCESARTPVTATINPLPSAPTVTGASGCSPSTITLSASGGTAGQYRWYTVPTGGSAISGQTNATFVTPSLSATTNYFVAINNGTCESTRTLVTATISGPCTQPPVINPSPLATQVGGSVELNLVSLITTTNSTLNVNSIQIVDPPSSGATATIANGVLKLNYDGITFSGRETFSIRACDSNGNCSTQQFEIEVTGDIIVYNAFSPNGDAFNPAFVIEAINLIPETKQNKVSIYNRWGDEVWKGENYDNTTVFFSGQNKNGGELPTGTYFYKIEFTSGRKMLTGFLSLRR